MPNRRAWIPLSIFLLIIASVVRLSISPPSAEWIGLGESEDISQVTQEEQGGKITKIATTKKIEPSKTLWDWTTVLVVPGILTILGLEFQRQQQKRAEQQAQEEEARAEDKQREDALEAYLESISNLLIDKGVSTLIKKRFDLNFDENQKALLDAGLNVIRARTFSVLRRLSGDRKHPDRSDGRRKTSVLLFLCETELIKTKHIQVQVQPDEEGNTIIAGAPLNIKDADFSEVDLEWADLNGVNLEGTNLRNSNFEGAFLIGAELALADFKGASLKGADLINADLRGANLRETTMREATLVGASLKGADLINADLTDADLTAAYLGEANLAGATLEGADLTRANLMDVEGWTPEQLSSAYLCGTALPKGCNLNCNLNCKELHLMGYKEKIKRGQKKLKNKLNKDRS